MVLLSDFGQTLIDSSSIEIYRKQKEWTTVYDAIDRGSN